MYFLYGGLKCVRGVCWTILSSTSLLTKMDYVIIVRDLMTRARSILENKGNQQALDSIIDENKGIWQRKKL